ncbi:MAG: ATP phosphoribosyltransferase regulatory subunit [Clostridia bacterium]|nr:ATP phosphoribosyltransferase regulatory subunit [Clostridia bacterium]
MNEDALLCELNNLYSSYGYRKYRSECFEDYSLFSENRDFLLCKNVLTFTDSDGKLRAMRPDVTISLIKHLGFVESTERLYYNERVFRQSDADARFREVSQAGVEVVGDITPLILAEVTLLSMKTLYALSGKCLLCVSHMGFVEGIFDWFGVEGMAREKLYALLKTRNIHDFKVFSRDAGLSEEMKKSFAVLTDGRTTLDGLESLVRNDKMAAALNELKGLFGTMEKLGFGDKMRLDFSVISDENYYDGLIFNGFIDGLPKMVLSGGRYDRLVRKLGKTSGAIGFALYLQNLERLFEDEKASYTEISFDSAADCLLEAEKVTKSGGKAKIKGGHIW